MAETFFDNPRTLSGSTDEKLRSLYNDLFTMSNKLNDALMNISIGQMAPEVRTAVQTGAQGAKMNEQRVNALKSMIIKTAEIVRSEMQEIRVSLESHYEAISSQFGTLTQNLDAQISATAAGILQNYNFEERITGVEQDTEEFIRKTSQYIFSGMLSDSPATYGIAIGYNVTNQDGTLNSANKMATFTADRLSFWLNNAEVAYLSNNVLHIANGEISDTLRMGSYVWKTLAGGAMGLMKG